MDMGSYVVIINAEKVKVTGNKEQQKMYYRHTGRPGSLKEENFKKLQAVRGAGPSHALDFAGRMQTPCLSAKHVFLYRDGRQGSCMPVYLALSLQEG